MFYRFSILPILSPKSFFYCTTLCITNMIESFAMKSLVMACKKQSCAVILQVNFFEKGTTIGSQTHIKKFEILDI